MRMHRQRGFNLIELVITIVVLGALMAGTLAYITNSMTAYTDVARRDQLTSLGRVAVERVARELRTAVPGSVRVSNNCIEFLPALGGSVYLTLPVDAADSSFTAVDFPLPASGASYIVVYPYSTASLYAQSNPGAIAGYSGKSGAPTATITLSGNFQFIRHAPHRRFYVAGTPVSFCISGSDLLRYTGYGMNAAQAAPPAGTGTLVAQDIQTLDGATAVTPFTYTPGTLRRNAIVTLDFRFLMDDEWIRLTHEVQLRNVL